MAEENKNINVGKSGGRGKAQKVQFSDFDDEFEFESQIFDAIKAARVKQKLSQRALAKKIGIPQSSLARLESGRMINPTLTFLKKVLMGLDLELKVCDIIIS